MIISQGHPPNFPNYIFPKGHFPDKHSGEAHKIHGIFANLGTILRLKDNNKYVIIWLYETHIAAKPSSLV